MVMRHNRKDQARRLVWSNKRSTSSHPVLNRNRWICQPQPSDVRSQPSMPVIARRMLHHDVDSSNTPSADKLLDPTVNSSSTATGSSSAVQLVTLSHLLSKEDNSTWLQSLTKNGIDLKTTPQAVATLEKLLCALAMGFLGTPHSTFTKDIVRLRHGFRTARCGDDYVCSAGLNEERPSFLYTPHSTLTKDVVRLRHGFCG
ncbi:hypothetical protein CLOP_g15288 [Closterium sp. NIES-67]|nr:hypothetical protein CLOP_g15288 [Closterium sp. NIES-67]